MLDYKSFCINHIFINCFYFHTLLQSLQSNKTLPHLMWVDFANNKDIITVPVTFLNLLKQRWPSHQYQPSFQELLDNKVVVQKSQFVLLV